MEYRPNAALSTSTTKYMAAVQIFFPLKNNIFLNKKVKYMAAVSILADPCMYLVVSLTCIWNSRKMELGGNVT